MMLKEVIRDILMLHWVNLRLPPISHLISTATSVVMMRFSSKVFKFNLFTLLLAPKQFISILTCTKFRLQQPQDLKMKQITIGFSRSSTSFPIFSWLIMLVQKTPYSHVYLKYQDDFLGQPMYF